MCAMRLVALGRIDRVEAHGDRPGAELHLDRVVVGDFEDGADEDGVVLGEGGGRQRQQGGAAVPDGTTLANADFEELWTGGYIFENEWHSFRTRQNRELELTTTEHSYDRAGRYTVAVKVFDIFGNDTMTVAPVTVG